MLNENMEVAINKQINAELFSSYLYLSMAAHLATKGLPGFANWMRIQAQEELVHAMKLFDHVNERAGKVVLTAIETPPSTWASPLTVFENALDHERKVTGLINNLVNLASETRDHASNNFLQWFVSEQVEEESSAAAIVDKLRLIGGDASGLFFLDQELAQRVFTPPTATP